MLNKEQNQDVGVGGVAIQAGGNVTYGISVADARAIALDVAKATFYELSGVARETMSGRVEEITEQVISKLEREYPDGLGKAIDPDFQHALYTVQKQYGRTGDRDLGDLLVDLLVDRSKQDSRDILQIVLNESLDVAPKLTRQHIASISLIFISRYAFLRGLADLNDFCNYLDIHIQPLAGELATNGAAFQHLQFTGCGAVQMSELKFESVLLHYYSGFFSNGFEGDMLVKRALSADILNSFIMRCFHDPNKYQIAATNQAVLDEMLLAKNVDGTVTEKIRELYTSSLMSQAQVREKCVELRPYMEQVFSAWNDSSMKSFTLTSVGMAIGHANLKRIVKSEFANLSIWIN